MGNQLGRIAQLESAPTQSEPARELTAVKLPSLAVTLEQVSWEKF